MKKDLKIVISGGGVAGLLLALSLHNLNLDPVVYEQAPTLISEAGGAVGMYPNGLSVIRDISPALLKEIRSFGQPYKLRKWYRHTGQVIATASEDKLREFNKIDLQELASIGIRRYRLQQCLVTACENAGIKIIYGNRINSVSICANKTVDCTLSDKTIVNCDLLFGCDGVKSAIRSSLFGQESDPEYTGVTCLMGVCIFY